MKKNCIYHLDIHIANEWNCSIKTQRIFEDVVQIRPITLEKVYRCNEKDVSIVSSSIVSSLVDALQSVVCYLTLGIIDNQHIAI